MTLMKQEAIQNVLEHKSNKILDNTMNITRRTKQISNIFIVRKNGMENYLRIVTLEKQIDGLV